MRNTESTLSVLSDEQVTMMEEHEQVMSELHRYLHMEFCGQLNFFKETEYDRKEIIHEN